MSTTRTALRAALGKLCGRGVYASSATTGTSTTTEIVDTGRTEFPDAWNGASIYFSSATAPKTAIVAGGDPIGRLYLTTALGSVPASLSAYELFKGLTFDDYNDAIDWACAEAYPHLYLPINDTTTVTEVDATLTYALNESWRFISQVRRQMEGISPTSYQALFEGQDYVLRHGPAGLEYETFITPKTGIKLHFVGRGVATLAAADASTTILPSQVIIPGALHYLYSKGSNADELAIGQKFDKKAQEQLALFEKAKMTFRMRPQTITARLPRIQIVNDGSTVANDW